MSKTLTIIAPHFAKIDGDWMIAVPAGQIKPGDQVTVSLKSGSTKTVTTSEHTHLIGDGDQEGWEFFDEARQARPVSRRTMARHQPSTSAAATPKQVAFAKKLTGAMDVNDRRDTFDRAEDFTTAELAAMSRAEISEIISLAKNA